MTNDEIAGRLIVMEAMMASVITTLMVQLGPDPNSHRARQMLDLMRAAVDELAPVYSNEAAKEARIYADTYLSGILENLDTLQSAPSEGRIG